MRDHHVIENEIDRAREDLEASLSELKHVVQDKLDIKAHARRAIEHAKYEIGDAIMRGKDSVVRFAGLTKANALRLAGEGKDGAIVVYRRSAATVRQRPYLFVGILGGLVLATGALLYVRHRRNLPWWAR